MRFLVSAFIFAVWAMSSVNAEVIGNINREEKKFGEWFVVCEEDVMLDNADCKAFTNFYNGTAQMFVQPQNQVANQIVLIIPQVLDGSIVQMRVDKNKLLRSDPVVRNEFGVIPLSPSVQKSIFEQLRPGQNLFLRFSVQTGKNDFREVTIKISLAEFSKMLVYYDMKMSKNN